MKKLSTRIRANVRSFGFVRKKSVEVKDAAEHVKITAWSKVPITSFHLAKSIASLMRAGKIKLQPRGTDYVIHFFGDVESVRDQSHVWKLSTLGQGNQMALEVSKRLLGKPGLRALLEFFRRLDKSIGVGKK